MTDLCFVTDLYHGNPVDFHKLANASYNGIKCVGIIHKASEGADVADPMYASRRPVALNAGFLWGAYAFNTGQPVADQVAEFLKIAAPDNATALFLDFEDNTQSEMSLAQAVEFLDRVEQAIGRHCRLYSGNRLKELIVRATDAERTFLAADPTRLWGCEYGPQFKDTDTAGHPLPWAAPFLWQDTGDGLGPQPHTLNGLHAGADLSVFKGTRIDLEQVWAGSGPKPLVPAQQQTAPTTATVPARKQLRERIEDEIEKIL